jgi:glucose/arabinose dehydrogenase
MPTVPWSRMWQAAVATLVATFAAIGAAHTQALSLELIASGLPAPLGLRNAGDGSNRLFIVNQGGTISIYKNRQVLTTPFLDVSVKTVYDQAERGLLGLAFDPNYATNGFFYIYYTSQPAAAVTISRYSVSANPDVADPSSEVVLATQAHSDFPNHNGGSLLFGVDGCLYAGIGDGGSGGDPNNNAQNLGTLLAKIIRISPVDGTPCAAAPGNPFVNTPNARGEIWALGVRNPWRITMDRQTGDFWIADVGQNVEEEVNLQPPGVAGRNYCWSFKEGTLIYNASIPCTIGTPTDPIIEYDHSAGKCAIIGGYRYRGIRFPRMVGTYFYADLCTGQIFGATESGGVWTSTLRFTSDATVTTFGEDEAGELYVVHQGGTIHRLDFGALASTHDFDGDTQSDIAWRNTNGDAAIWLMTTNQSGGAQILSSADYGIVPTSWQLVGQRDFNGDGKADLLWSNSNGDTSIWLMNGTTVSSTSDLGIVGNGWAIVGTGDFNGDGFGDILWRNTNGDTSVWLMTGNATQVQVLSATDLGSVPTGWSVAQTGDFNGDGKTDILWHNSNGDTSIWLMTSNGTQMQVLSTTDLGVVPTSWSIAGTGDFNGDGYADILWHNSNGNTSIWLMTSNGTQIQVLSTTGFGGVPTSWNIALTGDFNGDGKSDIFWRNSNGDTSIWFMTVSGTHVQVLSASDLGGVPTSWLVQNAGAD